MMERRAEAKKIFPPSKRQAQPPGPEHHTVQVHSAKQTAEDYDDDDEVQTTTKYNKLTYMYASRKTKQTA